MEIARIAFWVCVILAHDGKYIVDVDVDLSRVLTKYTSDEAVLYLRYFTDMQEAFGHKFFLEALSLETLKTCIATLNPRRKNLRSMSVNNEKKLLIYSTETVAPMFTFVDVGVF
jgi:hypothetical protein